MYSIEYGLGASSMLIGDVLLYYMYIFDID